MKSFTRLISNNNNNGSIFFSIIIFYCFFASFFTPSSSTAAISLRRGRRFLHQPFFPISNSLPPALPPTTLLQPPFPAPQSQPKYPFSSLSPPTNPQFQNNPFFPSVSPPPPAPPPPPSDAVPTFPANISSLILPHTSSSSNNHPISHKLIAVIVFVSLVSIVFIAAIAAFILLHHHRRLSHYHQHHQDFSKTDSLRLFPPNATPSDRTTAKNTLQATQQPPPSLPRHTPSSTSSEFLYLGTLVSSRDVSHEAPIVTQGSEHQQAVMRSSASVSAPIQYNRRLGSPELQPLPPLPRQQQQNFHQDYRNGSDEDDEFFSPRGSTGEKYSPAYIESGGNLPSSGSNSHRFSLKSDSLSSSPSIVLNLSPRSSMRSKSPDSMVNFPAKPLFIPPPPAREPREIPESPLLSGDTKNSPTRDSDYSGMNMESPGENLDVFGRLGGMKIVPPPPPPPPPPRFWDTPELNGGPPELVAPSRPVVGQNLSNGLGGMDVLEGRNENGLKPKLKPLHWDKVRASSDRAMVWDQMKSSSFQLNEEMIETLFTASNSNGKDGIRRPLMPALNQENQVLDPKKSQNIAILLRALNVTIEEVCEALLEGNADMLGTELLESLLKMAPTKEEERKLLEFTDESPLKLGPAEKFLKAVLHVPYAFKRVDALLYMANFDSEFEYLLRSFETLEEACKELRNSRMFLKLLEAVLKTGNRMNVGTNRGDAHAFKLDTLLKLVDVKGADGRTTLLHFVVQEIIRAEGSRRAGADQKPTAETGQQFTLQNELELRKLGLQIVSGLSGELSNVRKAASMDSDALNNDVLKLTCGIAKVTDVLKLNEELALSDGSRKFSESMECFLKKAEENIINIQAQEGVALSMVKELTEYFHGNLMKEEAHPFRIFVVVKDFLSILDQVCKDVGKVNERTIVSSARQYPPTMNPSLPHVFPGLGAQPRSDSSGDESSSLP